MTGKNVTPVAQIIHEKAYPRFNLGQRWEHLLLILSFTVLLLTGLPQKYRDFSWSQDLLSSPERLELIQQIHHIAAIVMTIEVLYHLGRAIYLITRRKLSGDIFPVWQDVLDAGQMLRYLLFMRKDKPKFGRYNFEQKVTYWVIFFGILIMVISGFIIWFPEFFTKFLPGGVIPAAKLAHSTEAVVAAIFILIWHIYHVHFERLNLSIFTGRLTEREMREFHEKEYERLHPEKTDNTQSGERQ
ncbi:MAG: cytochrome b/b6 domain-containing protein [Anaerolineae bacterium]|nr:cytochrome b/b6 domain-containing protein [Anaerolineae bacterium]